MRFRLEALGQRPVWLSVDLDYWLSVDHPLEKVMESRMPMALDFLHMLWRMGKSKGLSIPVTETHDQHLPIINQSGRDIPDLATLINVDYHSDLVTEQEVSTFPEANEGTWGTYVSWKWKPDSMFVWVRSCSLLYQGRCDIECHDYRTPNFASPTLAESCGWGELRSQASPTIQPEDLQVMNVVGAAVCLSPEYVHPTTLDNPELLTILDNLRALEGYSVLGPPPWETEVEKGKEVDG